MSPHVQELRRAYAAMFGGNHWIAATDTEERHTEPEQKPRGGAGKRLRAWREENHMRQIDAAQIFGVTNGTISNWETGNTNVPACIRKFIKKAACGTHTTADGKD